MKFFAGRSSGRIAAARFLPGSDLLTEINQMASEAGFKTASVQFIGAVRKAVLQVYDQAKGEYITINLEGPLEIVSGTGNISFKDGEAFAHIHVSLSSLEGKCFGGHLASGTEVFMTEIIMTELHTDRRLERKTDKETGLAVWG